MSYSLLLDFGATRIKSALVDDTTGQIQNVQSRPCTPAVCHDTHFEIPLAGLWRDFSEICKLYALQDFKRIFVCSQMHGFVLCDKHHQPLTEYISWQDERARLPHKAGPSSWELFAGAFGTTFKEKTGMRLRSCFPVVKILDYLRLYPTDYIKVLSLPEALLLIGRPADRVHITMAAGSGMIGFSSAQPDEDMCAFLRREGKVTDIVFNTVSTQTVPAGTVTINHRDIPVYTAIGDHQCAVFGAGNTLETLSFNIGTGSQVSAICTQAPNTSDTERRHFINGLELQTITHIPAGRVLTALIDFYHTLTGKDGWKCFTEVPLEKIQQASGRFNLGFFQDAWNYTNGGGITGLSLTDLKEPVLWAELFRSFAQQYIQAADCFVPRRKQLLLSGGKLAKLPALAKFFEQELAMSVCLSAETDETLVGLAKLAQEI